MRNNLIGLVGVVFSSLITVSAVAAPATARVPPAWKGDTGVKPRMPKLCGQLPLVFEPNLGQADTRVKWLARGPGYRLMLTGSDLVVALHAREKSASGTIRMRMAGGRPWRLGEGMDPTGGSSNYFLGQDP